MFDNLEVLEMMDEGRALIAVGSSTGGFHTIGHPRRAAREDSDLWQQNILLLKAIKELSEVWTTKVGHRTQASEQTAARQFLEVPLTDVLVERETSVPLTLHT